MQFFQTFTSLFVQFSFCTIFIKSICNSWISRILAFHFGMCCYRKKEIQLSLKTESTYANTIDLIHLIYILIHIVFKIFHPNNPLGPIPLSQKVHLDNLQKILPLLEEKFFETPPSMCFSKSRKIQMVNMNGSLHSFWYF